MSFSTFYPFPLFSSPGSQLGAPCTERHRMLTQLVCDVSLEQVKKIHHVKMNWLGFTFLIRVLVIGRIIVETKGSDIAEVPRVRGTLYWRLCKTRKPCCRKETARCRKCSFRLQFANNIPYKHKTSQWRSERGVWGVQTPPPL